jgi:hypothetical protein
MELQSPILCQKEPTGPYLVLDEISPHRHAVSLRSSSVVSSYLRPRKTYEGVSKSFRTQS